MKLSPHCRLIFTLLRFIYEINGRINQFDPFRSDRIADFMQYIKGSFF